MMDVYLTFNGESSQLDKFGIDTMIDIRRNILPPTRDTTLTVPHFNGVYDFGRDYRVREITVDFLMAAASVEDLRDKAREVASWLHVEEAKPLIFSDEPDKRYMARPTGGVSFDQIVNAGILTVNFMIPEVFAEAVQEETVGKSGHNKGTQKCPCIITATMQSASSYLQISQLQKGKLVLLHYDFETGDVIEIDTKNRTVYLNGDEDLRAYLDVISRYFDLPPGDFDIVTEPGDTELETVFRPRWI